MQESINSIPQWMQLALTAVASALSGVGIDRLYNSWLNRKKPASEIHLTEASTDEVIVRASSSAGDAVIRMMDRLSSAQEVIDRLRAERDAWQDEYDKVFVERDDILRRNGLLRSEIANYENEIKTMKATLTLRGQNYDNSQDAESLIIPPREKGQPHD